KSAIKIASCVVACERKVSEAVSGRYDLSVALYRYGIRLIKSGGEVGNHFTGGAKGRIERAIRIIASKREVFERANTVDIAGGDDFAVRLNGDVERYLLSNRKICGNFACTAKR